jgi:hypothetical protein
MTINHYDLTDEQTALLASKGYIFKEDGSVLKTNDDGAVRAGNREDHDRWVATELESAKSQPETDDITTTEVNEKREEFGADEF